MTLALWPFYNTDARAGPSHALTVALILSTWGLENIRRPSQDTLERAYRILDRALGPQHWWPGETAFEVIVGAILTQSTAWTNVEKAIANLKAHRLLSPQGLSQVKTPRLARLIRPSGYFNQKARRLKNFSTFLKRFGSLEKMFARPTAHLREELLALNGIGPETADSILLYAGGHPVFVVDAYTRRILFRHGWISETAGYDDIQTFFHSSLPRKADLFNQYHALLVQVGKSYCRRQQPLCRECPLAPMLPAGGAVRSSGERKEVRRVKP